MLIYKWRWGICLAMLLWGGNGISYGQRIELTAPPRHDAATTFLATFDGELPVGVKGDARFKAGKFGQAMITDKGLTIEHATAAENPLDPNKGTVEFWFKVDDAKWVDQNRVFLTNDVGYGKLGHFSIWLWRTSSGHILRVDLQTYSPLCSAYVGGLLPLDGKWHHLAFTWDRTLGVKLYLDGRLIEEKNITWDAVVPAAKKLLIAPGANNGLLLDELRLSNEARLAPENLLAWCAKAGTATVQHGQTQQAVKVVFFNRQKYEPLPIDAVLRVADYFQTPLAETRAKFTLKPGETREVNLNLITDNAGPYVKVTLSGVEGNEDCLLPVTEENLVFTDVLTGPRQRLSLNGIWEMAGGSPFNLNIPTTGWQPCELPYRWDTWGTTHTRWFRKRFALPSSMKGRRLELHLSGVRYRGDVIFNGRYVAGQDTAQMPWTVDVTDTAKIGDENELLIGVTDWLSCVEPKLKPALNSVSASSSSGAEVPGRPYIWPVTGQCSPAGIVDPLYLYALPAAAAIDSTFITPSVAKAELTVQNQVANHSSHKQEVTVCWQWIDKAGGVVMEQKRGVHLPPGVSTIKTVLPADQSKVTLWQPWQPYLYRLRTTLYDETETVADLQDTRFGFREFGVKGSCFQINGVPIKPHLAAGWPNNFPGLSNTNERSGISNWNRGKNFLKSFKDMNVNLVRYHTEPFPILMFDQADEIGLMLCSEAMMSSIPGKLNVDSPQLWTNLRDFYPRWVWREYNHPSLVIRSIENEMGFFLPPSGGCAAVGFSEETVRTITMELRKIGGLVKSLDPSRPIMYEGSGNPFSDVADVENIHYPGLNEEEPLDSRATIFPREAYGVLNWIWNRQKPLVIGETHACMTPRPDFFAAQVGEDAYRPYWNARWCELRWSLGMPNFRLDGVTSVFPWSPLEEVFPLDVLSPSVPILKIWKETLTPIATYIHQHRPSYFAGSTVNRMLTTLNDTMTAQRVLVTWRLLGPRDTILNEDHYSLALPPAGLERRRISFQLPAVSVRTPCRLVVETSVSGQFQHRDERMMEIFPTPTESVRMTSTVGVLGLSSTSAATLQRIVKTPLRNVRSAPDLTGLKVLIVDGGVTELPVEMGKRVERFLDAGGRIVLLNGTSTPKWLPFQLELVPGEPSTQSKVDYEDPPLCIPSPSWSASASSVCILHASDPNHPILAGLGPLNLRFWREDLITAAHTWRRPQSVTHHSILSSGKALKQSSLLEIPYGKGMVLAVQLPLLEALDDQPAARLLLDNLLRYVDTCPAQANKPVAVLAAANGTMETFIKAAGMTPYNITDKLKKIKDLTVYSLLIVDGTPEVLDRLVPFRGRIADFVKNGGIVWIHRPMPSAANALKSLLPVPVTPLPIPVVPPETLISYPIALVGKDLFTGVSHDSIWWTGNTANNAPFSGRVANIMFAVPENKKVTILANPVVAVSLKQGKGRWLLESVNWDTENDERDRAMDYVRAIVANCGHQIRPGKNHEAVTGPRSSLDQPRRNWVPGLDQ